MVRRVMVRGVLAIAVPLSLAGAARASGAPPPGWASVLGAATGGSVRTGAGPQGASPLWRASGASTLVPGRHVGPPASRLSGPAAPPPHGSTPAQDGPDSPLFGANGDAINIDPLGTCIACTGAGAASRDSSSYSRSIKVADESLAEGESPTNGYTGGSVVSLPPNPLLMLAIGTWQADNRHDATSAEGHSSASAAQLAVADGHVATLALFEARSDATRGHAGRHGSASSNAIRASLGGGQVMLILLHSDASTDDPGHVYVAQLNERQVMTSDELMGGFPITVPSVATVSLLRGGPQRAVVGDVADSKSNGAAEVVSTSVGNTSGPRNQTH